MRKTNKAIFLLLTLSLVYISVAGGLYLAQRRMIYFPGTETAAPADYGLGDGIIRTAQTDDGLTLAGWYWPPAAPDRPVVILFHGNAGHYGLRLSMAASYVEKGYGVLLAGYRGYAGNPGAPSEQGFYRDARAWLRFAFDSGITLEQIVLYGESLGTGVAVQMAVEHPDVRALVLQAPYTSLPDVAARRFFFLPVHLMMKDRFSSIDKIGAITMPLLVFQSTNDLVIPPLFTQRLYDAAPVNKKLIQYKDFGHNDMPLQERADALDAFLADQADAPKASSF